jgi:hypothetical protein
MSQVALDRCMNATTTTGTGTLTLGSAATGYRSIGTMADGQTGTFSAWAVDGDGAPTGDWEVFAGTYTASGTTLSRDVILASSNSGSAVSWSAGTKLVALVTSAAQALPDVSICQGRLTLTSGTPVTTSDVTAATTVYFTPYQGNRIALWNGYSWQVVAFAELSLSTTGLTAGKPYDVFAYLSSGAAAIEALVWTDDTTRATAITTQDGVAVKSGDATRRLLGTFYTFDDSGTVKTCDTAGGVGSGGTEARRFLCNKYNRVQRPCFIGDNTNSWSYNSNTWRAANNSSTFRATFVQTDNEQEVSALNCQNPGATGNAVVGVGVDTTTGFSGVSGWWNGTSVGPAVAAYRGYVGVGLHYVTGVENLKTGSSDFYGDVGWSEVQSGLYVTVWG